MEFELTLRGNADELTPLLELLGKCSNFPNRSIGLNNEEPEFPTETPWDPDLQETFWNDLSEGAQEFMMHLCMACDGGDLYGKWVCDRNGLTWPEEGACGVDVPCQNPREHRMLGQNPDGIAVVPGCIPSDRSMGARRANITRNMAAPKYADQTYPVKRIDSRGTSPGGESKKARYILTTNWPEFIFPKWCDKKGELDDSPQIIITPADENVEVEQNDIPTIEIEFTPVQGEIRELEGP